MVLTNTRQLPCSPWFGQAAYFKFFSPEKIPLAIERYEKEIVRVLGVLDGVLAKRRWLVGDKYSAADISFVTCDGLSKDDLLQGG